MARRCASYVCVCVCVRCWTKVHAVEIVIGAISRINEDILRPTDTRRGERKILVSIRFGISKEKDG